MLFRKSKNKPEMKTLNGEPALRCSICTGEQTAGYISKDTGKFVDVMLIRNEADLDQFCSEYGVDKMTLRKIY